MIRNDYEKKTFPIINKENLKNIKNRNICINLDLFIVLRRRSHTPRSFRIVFFEINVF